MAVFAYWPTCWFPALSYCTEGQVLLPDPSDGGVEACAARKSGISMAQAKAEVRRDQVRSAAKKSCAHGSVVCPHA